MEVSLSEEKFDIGHSVENYYIFRPIDEVYHKICELFDIDLETLTRFFIDNKIHLNLYAEKKNVSQGMIRTKNNKKFAFDTKTSAIDKLPVLDAFDEESNTVVIIKGFPLTTEQHDLLKKLSRETNLATRTLKKLGKDPMSLILFQTAPHDIPALCQTNEQFSKFCENPQVFRQLMEQHYPDLYPTNDPKQQFLAVISGIRSYYKCKTDYVDREKVVDPPEFILTSKIQDIPGWSPNNLPKGTKAQYDKLNLYEKPPYSAEFINLLELAAPEDTIGYNDDYFIFSFAGIPPVGETYWVFVVDEAAFQEFKLFKTREALADYYSNITYPNQFRMLAQETLDNYEEGFVELGEKYEYLDGMSVEELRKIFAENNLTERFDDYLRNRGISLPFTQEARREQAMHNTHLFLSNDSDHDHYYVIEAHF